MHWNIVKTKYINYIAQNLVARKGWMNDNDGDGGQNSRRDKNELK